MEPMRAAWEAKEHNRLVAVLNAANPVAESGRFFGGRSVKPMKLIFSQQHSSNLLHLERLAQCFGIIAESVRVQDFSELLAAVNAATASGPSVIVLDVLSLNLLGQPAQWEELAAQLGRTRVTVLLVVTQADPGVSQWVKTVTRDEISAVTTLEQVDHLIFTNARASPCGLLSGQEFHRKPGPALGLALGVASKANVLMQLAQSAAFVQIALGNAQVFIWSTLAIFDVQRKLAAEKEFEEAIDQYVPAIAFLRYAFQDQCWHNPDPGAGIIIDDPLLVYEYGFLNFRRLLGSARQHKYHVTLAFIPWNSRRSRTRPVEFFREHADCFSICAHGCDHTNNEFKSNDYDGLLRKNFVARQRMEQHHQRTGLACEPLMVCPQEQYSLEGMRAFADSRQFLALVNTGCMPRDLTTPQICGADLLLAAPDSFFGFPVFKRHYWGGDMAVFAMSLFLGKPAILAGHHEFFRAGPGGAEAFASGLAKLRPNLKWTSLVDTVVRTHLRRRVSDGQYEVRFFTDTFRWEHQHPQPVEYQLTRRISGATKVRCVRVNGCEVPFSQDHGRLAFSVVAEAPQNLEVRVEIPPVLPTKPYPSGLRYQSSVALRRGLSELRDNFIARNDFALKAGRKLMKTLKQTGGK